MFGIGSLLGRIFGTEKATTSIIDNVSKGLDALVYTDEEKAQDAAKDRAAARQMIIKWMETTKGQNLARRLIALSIVAVWLFQYLASTCLNVAAIWLSSPEKLTESARIIGESAKNLNAPIMLILAFYFSAPYMGDIARGVMVKFSKVINGRNHSR